MTAQSSLSVRRRDRRQRTLVPPGPAQRPRLLAQARAAFGRGDVEGALAAIITLLDVDADWTDGYRLAAELLWQCRGPRAFERWLVDIVTSGEHGMTGITACLRILSDAGFHDSVARLLPRIDGAEDHLFFVLLGAVAASETGQRAEADRLFGRAAAQGGGLSLPHARHLIKSGDPAQAAVLAEAVVADQPGNQTGWALLSTAWRMLGDPRHAWLVDRPGLVRVIDMDVAPAAMDALARYLRRQHVTQGAPFDQSLRGGTQTAGNILAERAPEIAALRIGFFSALGHYVAGLPPEDARHPLLGRRRDALSLAGSWSVRLLGRGFHVSHVHDQGTVSAAFYVALPPPSGDDPQAGWLTIGNPPETLATGLDPLHVVEPKLARLVLFPSFLWHGTRPFAAGERISVAFDTMLGTGDEV